MRSKVGTSDLRLLGVAMRIIIESANKPEERIVFENVYQFSLCGSLQKQKMFNETFRRSVIADANELIGLLRATEMDILDHKKKGARDADPAKG